MPGVRRFKAGLGWMALCLLVGAAQGQDVPPPGETMWFEVESNALGFGEMDPDFEALPERLLVRVHSDRDWALRLLPSPGLLVETGASVPLDRLHWRPGATGPFVPLDNNSPVALASGPPTGAAGDLVLTELWLRLHENDPTGRYRFDLRLVVEPLDRMEALPDPAAKRAPAETNDQTVTVTASAQGLFECTLNLTGFDFGDVDLSGSSFGTPNVVALGRNATNTGGLYQNAPGSVTWQCRSAPKSTVGIALATTAADHTGGMATNDIEVRIPSSSQGGTSTGYQLFASQAPLITGMFVGNGSNAANGTLDLRLTVLDADPPGVNTWIVRLRAAGNP